VVAKKAGQFAGGFFNNPGVLATIGIIGAIAIPLIIFRKDITNALANAVSQEVISGAGDAVGGAISGAGQTIVNIFGGAGDAVGDAVGGIGDAVGGIGEAIGDAVGGIGEAIEEGLPPIGDEDFTDVGQAGARGRRGGGEDVPLGAEPIEQLPVFGLPRTEEEGGIITVSEVDEFGIGGGLSFEGGVTTFGGGIVDTFSEVLALFPELSASMAGDLLRENPDLTQSEFRLLDPDVLNISNIGFEEGEQTLLNAGEFSGLSPEQIAFILTGGDISNF